MISTGVILSMLRHSQDATLIYTSDELHIGYVNDAMLRILNKPKSIEGQRLEDIAPEFKPYFSILKDLWQKGEKLLLKESPADIDYEGKLVTTYFDIEYQPLRDEEGQTIAIINTARDVTDRMLAQTLLKEKEEREARLIQELEEKVKQLLINEQFLNRFIMEAPAALALMRGSNFLYNIHNAAYQAILPGRQLTGRTFFEVVPELKGTHIEDVLNDVYYNGISYSFIETLVPLSEYEGGPTFDRYFTFNYFPWIDEKGQVDGVVNLAVEVTEAVKARLAVEQLNDDLKRANAEEVAINSELKLANKSLAKLRYEAEQAEYTSRIAIEAANFGTWHLDTYTKKLTTNDRLKELFGFEPYQEVELEDYIKNISAEHRESVSAAIEATIKNGGHYDLTYMIDGKPGKPPRWVRAIGKLQADMDGRTSVFTGLVTDITAQKADEVRKNDFIGMVSHELKTPLTSLHTIVQLAAAKLKKSDDAFLVTAMEKATLQTKKMSRLINGFLNVSRLESGQLQIERQPFILGDLLREMVEEARFGSPSFNIELESGDEIIINADRDKIASVVTNLLSNAMKYSPKGSLIIVNCDKQQDQIIISVTDQGIGIRAEDSQKLFDRYYRVQDSAVRNISGFGIGLYLSAEIIKSHHGRIWVESNLGKGSTFYISLPTA